MVADCAIYTEQNIKLMSNIKWLSRVPLTIKEAKTLVTTLPESEFIQSKIDGYSSVEKKVSYAGIEQRWLVVQSRVSASNFVIKNTDYFAELWCKSV